LITTIRNLFGLRTFYNCRISESEKSLFAALTAFSVFMSEMEVTEINNLVVFCVTFTGPTWYWFKERPGVRELLLVETVFHLLTPSQYLGQVLLSLRVVT